MCALRPRPNEPCQQQVQNPRPRRGPHTCSDGLFFRSMKGLQFGLLPLTMLSPRCSVCGTSQPGRTLSSPAWNSILSLGMAETRGSERYRVPDGLRPLLEALARETLRAQPYDLPDFALLFFTELHAHRRSWFLFLVSRRVSKQWVSPTPWQILAKVLRQGRMIHKTCVIENMLIRSK